MGQGSRTSRGRSALAATLVAVAAHALEAQTAKSATTRGRQPPAAAQATSAGVYTTTQATRGERAYRARCNSCHAATAYTGATFAQLYVGRTAYDMVNLLRRTMPNDDPGGLPKQQYVDIVAYLFRLNGYPAGARALATDDVALKRVRIDRSPGRP